MQHTAPFSVGASPPRNLTGEVWWQTSPLSHNDTCLAFVFLFSALPFSFSFIGFVTNIENYPIFPLQCLLSKSAVDHHVILAGFVVKDWRDVDKRDFADAHKHAWRDSGDDRGMDRHREGSEEMEDDGAIETEGQMADLGGVWYAIRRVGGWESWRTDLCKHSHRPALLRHCGSIQACTAGSAAL